MHKHRLSEKDADIISHCWSCFMFLIAHTTNMCLVLVVKLQFVPVVFLCFQNYFSNHIPVLWTICPNCPQSKLTRISGWTKNVLLGNVRKVTLGKTSSMQLPKLSMTKTPKASVHKQDSGIALYRCSIAISMWSNVHNCGVVNPVVNALVNMSRSSYVGATLTGWTSHWCDLLNGEAED